MAGHELGGDVSRETSELLETYAGLIRRWNKTINLVSRSTMDDIWSRHILDSLQLADAVPEKVSHYADLGSGAGLPGIVVALQLRARGQDARITLVESDKRKSAFLLTAARELGLDIAVKAERLETLQPLGADVITARALAPLGRLLEHQQRHGEGNCTGIYPKGAQAAKEIEEALEDWRFTCERLPSRTSPDSSILKIGDLRRA